MAVTMADITKLRKMTGAGMMDCKNALTEAEGDFDKAMEIIRKDVYKRQKYSRKKQIEYKEQFTDPNEPIRLNKFLANAGVCSRREADEFITAGVVSVNGAVVTELGTKIKRGDEVKFHDQTVSIERKDVYKRQASHVCGRLGCYPYAC